MSPEDDNWNRIVIHNVEQFQKDQDDAKQRARENQLKMKAELEKQVQLQKRVKEDEKRQELAYMQKIKELSNI